MLTLLLMLTQEAYQAPSPEPTPEETLILELMNRFRSDPAREADLLAPPGKSGGGVDWDLFRREMKALKPAPPLVFNLNLLDSARKHSYYMVFNGLGHVEDPGKKGFTGVGFGDRAKAAGYKGFAGGENAFAGSFGAAHSHEGFVVDGGEGPGGMQPGRGHRMNMINPGFREVGPGGVPNGRGLSVTHNFGSQDARFAGGVIYVDLDGDSFYDIGEGLGSATIVSTDGANSTTWASGAYTLELKGKKDVTLTAILGTEKFSKTFAAGPENIKFDWAVPKDVLLQEADQLIEAAEKASDPKSSKHLQSRVALYLNTQPRLLDPDRRAKVTDLVKEVGAALDADRHAIMALFKDPEIKDAKRVLEEHRKDWKGTEADAWFQDAELMAKLTRGVNAFLKQPKPSEKEKKAFLATVEQEGSRLRTPAFKPALGSLVARLK